MIRNEWKAPGVAKEAKKLGSVSAVGPGVSNTSHRDLGRATEGALNPLKLTWRHGNFLKMVLIGDVHSNSG